MSTNMHNPVCHWDEDDTGVWATDCRHEFEINEGTPDDNGMKFCCYCGKPLVQRLLQEGTDDE